MLRSTSDNDAGNVLNGIELYKKLNMTPCAACIIKNDADLTLADGNESFYGWIGFSEEDISLRYGGRMAALFSAESIKALGTLAADGKSDQLKLRINRQGGEAYVLAYIGCVGKEHTDFFYCLLFDITEYEAEKNRGELLGRTVDILSEQTGLDYFEYDMETDTAKLNASSKILPRCLAVDAVCENFVERVLAADFLLEGYEREFEKAFSGLCKNKEKTVCELEAVSADGQPLWIKMVLVARDGAAKTAVCIMEDITPQKKAAHNYLTETQFYQAILAEKDAYAQVDVTEDRITRTGGIWNLYNEIIDKVTYTDLIQEFINKVVHPDDRKHYLEIMQRSNFIESLDNGIDRLGCEFRRIVEQNKMVWMQLSINLFKDPLTKHVLALLCIANIDDKKRQELLLFHDSRLDQLTNMYNRKMAESEIKYNLSRLSGDELCAFMILDLDNFKNVNDSLGHKAGDDVLMRLADILSNAFRKSDVIGRYGGDEFIIFVRNIKSKDHMVARLHSLYKILAESEGQVPLSCSIGVSVFSGEQSYSYKEAFEQADIALYKAKSAGKGCFSFYDDDNKMKYTMSQDSIEAYSEVRTDWEDITQVLPRNFNAEEMDFNTFISEQGDITYLVNPINFVLLCGNKAFYDRIGMTEPQCRGKKCYELMHKRETPCPFCGKASWARDKFYMWKNYNLALEQEFLIKNKLVQWEGNEALLAIAVDISNDKSIVDSLDNEIEESQNMLVGIQRMADEETLSGAMESALETIGFFFRADTVCIWQKSGTNGAYERKYVWDKLERSMERAYSGEEVDKWMSGKNWTQPITLENPEAMLCHSYDMYQVMKARSVRNQRWFQIRDNGEVCGCISIDNISSNFQNVAFIESFSVFIAAEMKKRGLIENAIYADRHDDLTNLLSRKSFEEYMALYDPDEVPYVGVVLANFNNLKGVNSTHGFQTGNYYIMHFADMLRKIFCGDNIYRLNGDEFLVISTMSGRTMLEEKISELQAAIMKAGDFTVSLGYSWDDVEKDISVLMEQSTQAMRLNKKRHYDSMPVTEDTERRKMLSDLVTSIESGEFEVFMQPKVEYSNSEVIGAEALIRYRHSELGIIPPSKFIDMLENNNLIRFIDLFVFEEVCKNLEKWKHENCFLPIISLNFSRLTLLERDILSYMEEIIARYDVSKSNLEIEITESVANMGKSMLYQAACDIYGAGYAISLDDFGTKYTNLSILADIDFSMLKLDKSLIGELGNHPTHKLILKNVVNMCNDLDIKVIAEGVETEVQENILREINCQMGQGYLYGKPMPIDEFYERYIKNKCLPTLAGE